MSRRSAAVESSNAIARTQVGMRKVILGLLCLALIPTASFGQQTPGDWNNVQVLAPGSGIFLKTQAGQKYHGALVQVTGTTLRLDSDERAFPGRTRRVRDFRREDIGEVRLLAPARSALAGAALGGGIGAGLGAGLDAMPSVNDDPHLATGILAALGAAIGGVVGRNISLVKGRRIYVAP